VKRLVSLKSVRFVNDGHEDVQSTSSVHVTLSVLWAIYSREAHRVKFHICLFVIFPVTTRVCSVVIRLVPSVCLPVLFRL